VGRGSARERFETRPKGRGERSGLCADDVESWVNDVVLEDLEDYQARRVQVCRGCGAPGDGVRCRWKQVSLDNENYWNQQSLTAQNAESAYSKALTMLKAGFTPNDETLAAAGINRSI